MKIKMHNHSMSFYLLSFGLMFSGYLYAATESAQQATTQILDYPWEVINTDLKYEEAKAIILDGGFQPDSQYCSSRARPESVKDICTFNGKWKGKWQGSITVYAQDGHIRNLSFNMYYPLSEKAKISNYFYQTIRTVGKAAESCNHKDIATYMCDYVEDTKTSVITEKPFYHHYMIRANPKSGKDTMVNYKINEARVFK